MMALLLTAMGLLTWLKPLNEPIHLLELKLLDYRYQLRRNLTIDPRIAIIDIDTESLKNEGRWSWPYEKHALLINILHYLGVQSVGFDIFLVEPSRNVIDYDRLADTKQTRFTIQELQRLKSNSDELMKEALNTSRFVFLPQIFAYSDESGEGEPEYYDFYKTNRKLSFDHQSRFSLPVTPPMQSFLKANEASPLLHYFAEVAKGTAFAQILPDVDGTVRHYPLFYQYQGRAYLALGFMMALDDMGVPVSAVRVVTPHQVEIALERDTLQIPITSKGLLLINWMGPYLETYPHIPYVVVKQLIRHIQLRELKRLAAENPDLLENDTEFRQLPEVSNMVRRLGAIDTCLWLLQAASIAQFYLNDDPGLRFDQFAQLTDLPPEKQADVQSIFFNVKYHSMIHHHPDWDLSRFLSGYPIEDTAVFRRCMKNLSDRTINSSDYPLFFYDPIHIIGLGDIDERYFQKKILFYGLTATGTHDYNPTPYEPRYAMVGVHANIFDNIVNKRFLKEATIIQNLLWWMGITLLMVWGLRRMKTLWLGATSLGLFTFNLIANYWVFSRLNIWYSLLSPSLLIIAYFLVISIHNYRREEKEKRKIKDAFSHYVAPSVVEIILKKQDMLKLGGEKRYCTVFFSDIQGFTSISEQRDPVDLVESLNHYLNRVTQIILQHGGMLDKYEGDAVMAVFGAPLELPGHPVKACRCALEIQKALQRDSSYPTRIGINTGEMIAGNMGSATRFNYTVIGDAVNLGSRLEGANKQYGSRIMISEFTARELKNEFVIRELDLIRVKGKSRPVKVYELMEKSEDADIALLQLCRRYHEALEAYHRRDWTGAETAFQILMKSYPHDPVIALYRERCNGYRSAPPAQDWDGVFEMLTK